MKIPPLLSMLMLVLFTLPVSAQKGWYPRESLWKSFGAHVSFANTYNDDGIGTHPEFGAFVELSLPSRDYLNIGLDYFQTNKSISSGAFEYRGTTYYAQEERSWRSFNLMVSYMTEVTEAGSVGIGLGADLARVRQTSLAPGRNAWVVDSTTDIPHLAPSALMESTEWIVRPSLMLRADLAWPISTEFSFVAGVGYKLTFAGSAYGHGALNTLNTLTASIGLGYQL